MLNTLDYENSWPICSQNPLQLHWQWLMPCRTISFRFICWTTPSVRQSGWKPSSFYCVLCWLLLKVAALRPPPFWDGINQRRVGFSSNWQCLPFSCLSAQPPIAFALHLHLLQTSVCVETHSLLLSFSALPLTFCLVHLSSLNFVLVNIPLHPFVLTVERSGLPRDFIALCLSPDIIHVAFYSLYCSLFTCTRQMIRIRLAWG